MVAQRVAVTGIGMVTPLGKSPNEVLRRIQAGDTAAAGPTGFEPNAFACPVCSRVADFEPQRYTSEAKLVRLMNRDAQLAVAAARLALQDAGVRLGTTHQPEEVALFGATGLAGLPLGEVTPLIKASAGLDGEFDAGRFGRDGLKAVSPILSFKILGNMPLCFVSINEGIQGPNGVYAPWEGQGAQAVVAGIRALGSGDARCALVGGCDVKTHELAFASLEQQGLFRAWREKPGASARVPASSSPAGVTGKGGATGVIPGEGAAFLVLESASDAEARGAHIYAQIGGYSLRTHGGRTARSEVRAEVVRRLDIPSELGAVVSAANGDELWGQEERRILKAAGISAPVTVCPKKYAGDLFAAAAVLQVALGALLTGQCRKGVLANCFGHGSEQGAFLLDPP